MKIPLLALCLTLLLGQLSVQAAGRFALVIGNEAYQHSRKLANPVNDATAMQGKLQAAGFTVTLVKNATHQALEAALKDFSRQLQPDSVAVVYYAGHGLQTGGVSYLLPIDARADAAETLKYEAVALDLLLDLLDRGGQGAALKFVILDCCRDDPFGRGWRGDRDPAGLVGLAAPASTPSGTVLCYATDPGKVASDGRGANSPYTTGLVKHLFTPGLDFDLALRRVGAEVQSDTGKKQNPWRNANFNGSFAFVPGNSPTAPPPVEMRPSIPAVSSGLSSLEGTRAGELRTIGGIEMVWCPAGEFTMGSPESEQDLHDDEKQVKVKLTRGFWMARTECTQAQYEAVAGQNPSNFKGVDLPVDSVSHDDAVAYIAKLNATVALPVGWHFALPTEAQWEYACRAGTKGRYAGELAKMAWYYGLGNTTREVGTKAANGWGLLDMHGNVWEWCGDWYGETLPGGVNPRGAASGVGRAYRGGSWNDGNIDHCRAAYRHWLEPGSRNDRLGFRPALVPSDE